MATNKREFMCGYYCPVCGGKIFAGTAEDRYVKSTGRCCSEAYMSPRNELAFVRDERGLSIRNIPYID